LLGEGQKLKDRGKYFDRLRVEFLSQLLGYWRVGQDNYSEIMRSAIGSEWDDCIANYCSYVEKPEDCPDKLFGSIFVKR